MYNLNYSAIAKPLSRKAIREMANKLRSYFEISEEVPFPVIEFLELLASDGESLNYMIVADNELKGCYAKTLPDKNLILIKECVYNGACDGNPRDRFTIAHELGHFLLHDGNSISFARSDEKIKAYQNPEWQANTFAAELLLPSTAIVDKTIEQISKKYNVSLKVAEIQLSHVN